LLSILQDLSRIGDEIEGWMDRVGNSPLDTDRAWLVLLILRAMEGDWGGRSTRCKAYRDFALRLNKQLLKSPSLDLGPTPGNLWASYMAFTWKLGTERRCEDAYRDSALPELLDQQLEAVEALFPKEAKQIGRMLESLKSGPTPDKSYYKEFPQALRDRFPRVQSLVFKNWKLSDESPTPEDGSISPFIR